MTAGCNNSIGLVARQTRQLGRIKTQRVAATTVVLLHSFLSQIFLPSLDKVFRSNRARSLNRCNVAIKGEEEEESKKSKYDLS